MTETRRFRIPRRCTWSPPCRRAGRSRAAPRGPGRPNRAANQPAAQARLAADPRLQRPV